MSLKAIQAEWYEKLAESGFEEIEDHTQTSLPLKRWTGVSVTCAIIDMHIHQAPEAPVITSFPEPIYNIKEDFMNYIEFERACEFICRNNKKKGNRYKTVEALNVKIVTQIWQMHVDGFTVRAIDKKLGICWVRVHNVIHKLNEWLNLMSTTTEILPTYEDDYIEPKKVTVIVRPYVHETDAPLLFSSWRNSLWYDQERDESLANEFYRKANRQIKELLLKPNIKVKVACLSDDPDQIAGYAVMRHNNIEWVYIKLDYRRQGIATLLTKGFESISHPLTVIGESIAKKHSLKIKEDHSKHGDHRRDTKTDSDQDSRYSKQT